MNTKALRSIRIGQGKDTAHMAKVIGKSNDSYAKKERGDVKFTPSEIELVVNDLDLSPVQMSTIFFDSKLPFSKNCGDCVSNL